MTHMSKKLKIFTHFKILSNKILFLVGGIFVILNLYIFLSSHFLFTFTQIKQPKNHLTFYQLSINFLSFNILSFNFLSFKFLFLSKHTLSVEKKNSWERRVNFFFLVRDEDEGSRNKKNLDILFLEMFFLKK